MSTISNWLYSSSNLYPFFINNVSSNLPCQVTKCSLHNQDRNRPLWYQRQQRACRQAALLNRWSTLPCQPQQDNVPDPVHCSHPPLGRLGMMPGRQSHSDYSRLTLDPPSCHRWNTERFAHAHLGYTKVCFLVCLLVFYWIRNCIDSI